MDYKAALFDLDGVLVDTALLHYQAWKQMADSLKIPFTINDNERLKGVSRMESLEIILSLGDYIANDEEKKELIQIKNTLYVSYIQELSAKDLLPGAEECLLFFKRQGIKMALGSASRNAKLILEKVGLVNYFDAIVDGNMVSKSKPDPEVFIKGAELCKIKYSDCVVFEDSIAGIKAAQSVNMRTVGIGSRTILTEADIVVEDLKEYLEIIKGGKQTC